MTAKSYKGFNINISPMSINGYFIVDINRHNGEHVWGWEFVDSFSEGFKKAVYFINNFV